MLSCPGYYRVAGGSGKASRSRPGEALKAIAPNCVTTKGVELASVAPGMANKKESLPAWTGHLSPQCLPGEMGAREGGMHSTG